MPRRTARWIVLLLVAMMAPAVAEEGRIRIRGEPVQGAVLQGEVPPNSTVRYAGRDVRVADDGGFVIGLGRDAPERVSVTAEFPDGTAAERTLTVRQRDYEIQRIDGLPTEQVTPGEDALARIRREAARIGEARRRADARQDYRGDWVWPVTGPITGVYGSQRVLNGEPRRPHYGVDVAAPTGTPVKAPAAGVVSFADDDLFFSGGTLLLDHGHGLSSAFLHLERILVDEGERVERGDVIAEVGATGRVTGAHLDWRINWSDRRVDPTLLVPPMPESG